MSSRDKLIQTIFSNTKNIAFDEVETLLLWLGFKLKVSGPHYVFRKADIDLKISLKKRPQLYPYQVEDLREVLKKHGYKEK